MLSTMALLDCGFFNRPIRPPLTVATFGENRLPNSSGSCPIP